MLVLDFLLAGLVIGGIYALIAIGLNLQYGVARVLNLAYGEFLMLAGYAAFWGFTLIGASPFVTLIFGVPAAFAASWLLFMYVLYPLLARTRDSGKREIDSIISTFGLLFVLQGVALVLWTGTDRAYTYLAEPIRLAGAQMSINRFVTLVAALGLAIGVYAALRYSKSGRAMRSIASNPDAAPLVGVDVKRYSALAFASGGALAAVAGILISMFFGMNPTIGAAFTMKALIVVVMGGIGHVIGGLVAGIFLGVAEQFGALLLNSGLITVVSFTIFSIVLLWKPEGLFGGAARTSSGRSIAVPKELIALLVLAALIVAPRYIDSYRLAQLLDIFKYVALATGWAFFSGPTRYISLAASAFYGVGNYAVAVIAPDYGYLASLGAAAVIGIVLSAFVGLATLRLKGMYFVIFTFGLATLVREVVTWYEASIAMKAGRYLYSLPVFTNDTTRDIYYQLLVLCVFIVGLWLIRDRTRMGFAMKTLGADETVARQIGINTTALKIGTFVVSALVMTLAGAIMAPRASYIDPTTAFNPSVSFLTVIMALLGGANSVWGPMLGVIPLVLIQDFISIRFPNYFSIILGLCFLGIVFFIPNGLLGLLQGWRAKWRAKRDGPQ
jgi:branched-subunit amino acid ABC-type transport system permease component